MKEDRKWSSVCSKDDDFADTTVQGLRSFVGTFLELAVVGGLLDDVQDLLGCAKNKN